MTYEESAALMQESVFRGRIKVAVLKYGSYIFNEAPSVPAHSTRIRWAQQTAQSPDQAAAQVQPMVVMEPQVQLDGAAITDESLQTSVEVTVNKLL